MDGRWDGMGPPLDPANSFASGFHPMRKCSSQLNTLMSALSVALLPPFRTHTASTFFKVTNVYRTRRRYNVGGGCIITSAPFYISPHSANPIQNIVNRVRDDDINSRMTNLLSSLLALADCFRQWARSQFCVALAVHQ